MKKEGRVLCTLLTENDSFLQFDLSNGIQTMY